MQQRRVGTVEARMSTLPLKFNRMVLDSDLLSGHTYFLSGCDLCSQSLAIEGWGVDDEVVGTYAGIPVTFHPNPPYPT